jgi:hypothetical protein
MSCQALRCACNRATMTTLHRDKNYDAFRKISLAHMPSLAQTALSKECGALDQDVQEIQVFRAQLMEKEL